MPNYGPMGYGSYPYGIPNPNFQGGVAPNFYPGGGQPQPPQYNPSGVNQPNYNNQQSQVYQYALVKGLEEAEAFPVQPNQSIPLFDTENPFVYMKTVDSSGRSNIKYYPLRDVSRQEALNIINPQANPVPNTEFVSKADFEALNKKVDDYIMENKKLVKTPKTSEIKED